MPGVRVKEQAGRPGQLDSSGLGTVVRSETGGQGQPPGKVRRVVSRRGHGVHGRVIGAWGDPSGGRVENGLWRSREDEGDKGGKGCLRPGQEGEGRKLAGREDRYS